METKKYKQPKNTKAPVLKEPQVSYGIDTNALKLAGIDALMNIDNPTTLEKAVKSLLKTAKTAAIEEETISKEEILAGIREGLLEMKERRRTGSKPKTAEELLNEL